MRSLRQRFVYFIQAGEGGPIKIGVADSPSNRVTSMQTSNHAELRLLGFMRGDVWKERAVHQRFAHLRLRGEWFSAGSELVSFAEQRATGRRKRAA